jgi:steroid delta-isomerase-like uncharacterized protein
MAKDLSTEAKKIIHRWFDEVWNEGKENVIDELMHPQIVGYGLTPDGSPVGVTEFKVFYHNLRSAFPDVHVAVEDAFEEGNKIAMRLTITGTHTGEGLGFPPTNKPISVSGMVMSELQNGQIIRAWNLVDNLSMMQQLGAVELK